MASAFQRLPQELFEAIVSIAVLASPVHTALRWRRVDRRFGDVIEPLLLRTGRLLRGPRGAAYASRCVWSLDLAARLVERELDNPDLMPPDLRHCVRLLEARLLGLRRRPAGEEGGGGGEEEDHDAYAAAVRRGVCGLLARASEIHLLSAAPAACIKQYQFDAFYPQGYSPPRDANLMERWLTLSEADVQKIGLGCPDYEMRDGVNGWWCLDAAAMAVAALGLGGNEPLRHLAALSADCLTPYSMFGQYSALAVAAEVGNVEAVRVLLPLCTELTRRKDNPLVKTLIERALWAAARHGHPLIVDGLLQYATQQDHHETLFRTVFETVIGTCFMEACVGGHIELAREMLGRIDNIEEPAIGFMGPSKVTAHARWATAALIPVLEGPRPSPETFEYLINQGASLQGKFVRSSYVDAVCSRDYWKQDTTELILPQAISSGHGRIVQLLLQHGATGRLIQIQNACEDLIRNDDPSTMKLVLEGGALLAPHEGGHKVHDSVLQSLFHWSLTPWVPRIYQVLLDYDLAHNAGRAALAAFSPDEGGGRLSLLRHVHHLRRLLRAGLLGGGGDAAARALHMAIHAGDAATIRELLAGGLADANAEMVYEYYRYELGESPGLVAPALVQVFTPLARVETCIDELHAPRLRPYRRAFERLAEMLAAEGGVSRKRKVRPGPELDGIPRYYKGGSNFYCGATDRERCMHCATDPELR